MNIRTAQDGVELGEPEIDTLRRLNLKPALGAEPTLENAADSAMDPRPDTESRNSLSCDSTAL